MSKNTLAEGLRSLTAKPTVEKSDDQSLADYQATTAKSTNKGKHYRPSRQGTKVIAAHADPAVSKQLRQLALDEDTSAQALVLEALNLLFEKYALPQIAPDRFRK